MYPFMKNRVALESVVDEYPPTNREKAQAKIIPGWWDMVSQRPNHACHWPKNLLKGPRRVRHHANFKQSGKDRRNNNIRRAEKLAW